MQPEADQSPTSATSSSGTDGTGSGRQVWVAAQVEQREPGLRREVESALPGVEWVVAEETTRPTPDRRARRRATVAQQAQGARALIVIAPEALPLEVALGLADSGRPYAVLERDSAPEPSLTPPALEPGRTPPAPSPTLARTLAHAGLVGADRRTVAADLSTIPPDLESTTPDATPPSIDEDLVACCFQLEEQYRRLADWSVDLAEQAADREAGAGALGPLRTLRRRVRRFLRKRGLR
ncbi:MAG: hypothetical protein ACYSWX_11760 [Planctomycetota bacterium]